MGLPTPRRSKGLGPGQDLEIVNGVIETMNDPRRMEKAPESIEKTTRSSQNESHAGFVTHQLNRMEVMVHQEDSLVGISIGSVECERKERGTTVCGWDSCGMMIESFRDVYVFTTEQHERVEKRKRRNSCFFFRNPLS